MIKRIYAIVTDKEFFQFRRAVYSQDKNLGEVLHDLVIGFTEGKIELKVKHEKKKEATRNEYLTARALGKGAAIMQNKILEESDE